VADLRWALTAGDDLREIDVLMQGRNESTREDTALAWLEGLGDVVLAALPDALRPKLLSGEIRIKAAERIAGEVA